MIVAWGIEIVTLLPRQKAGVNFSEIRRLKHSDCKWHQPSWQGSPVSLEESHQHKIRPLLSHWQGRLTSFPSPSSTLTQQGSRTSPHLEDSRTPGPSTLSSLTCSLMQQPGRRILTPGHSEANLEHQRDRVQSDLEISLKFQTYP